MKKPSDWRSYIGIVEMRVCRATKTPIGLYRSLEAGMESDPEMPYSTVCEVHHNLVCHETLALARAAMAHPDWCEECQEKLAAHCLVVGGS